MSKLDEFLAGERLDDVALYLAESELDADGALADRGESVDGGVVLVVDGEKGRRLFSAGTGMDAMQFAKSAMDADGEIAADLGGATCPAAGDEEDDTGDGDGDLGADGDGDDDPDGDGEDHHTKFVFAFAEAENEEVGGRYAEGDVIHAYANCACGERFSQKWVVGER